MLSYQFIKNVYFYAYKKLDTPLFLYETKRNQKVRNFVIINLSLFFSSFILTVIFFFPFINIFRSIKFNQINWISPEHLRSTKECYHSINANNMMLLMLSNAFDADDSFSFWEKHQIQTNILIFIYFICVFLNFVNHIE